MPEPDLFLFFVRPLNHAGIPYAITGSVAAIFYGEARLTHDVDLVVAMKSEDIQTLGEVFPPAEFYVPPADVILQEMRRQQGGQFNIIHMHTGFKADLFPAGRDELNVWAIRQRRQVQFEGETLSLAPPEYVIIRKLEYYREGGSQKHLRDFRSMLAISPDQVDFKALNELIASFKLQTEWQEVSS